MISLAGHPPGHRCRMKGGLSLCRSCNREMLASGTFHSRTSFFSAYGPQGPSFHIFLEKFNLEISITNYGWQTDPAGSNPLPALCAWNLLVLPMLKDCPLGSSVTSHSIYAVMLLHVSKLPIWCKCACLIPCAGWIRHYLPPVTLEDEQVTN